MTLSLSEFSQYNGALTTIWLVQNSFLSLMTPIGISSSDDLDTSTPGKITITLRPFILISNNKRITIPTKLNQFKI